MKNLRILMPILLIGLTGQLSLAQVGFQKGTCGTLDGKVDWLQEYQANPFAFPRSEDTLYLPLTIHLVGTNGGSGYFSMGSLLDAFCTLNEDFASTRIRFYIEGEISYIPNTTYYNHNYSTGEEMMTIYNVPNTINCYISNSPGENLCGYSAYNLGVALAQNCIQPNDHTWAHELGHYLSLPHPFYGWEGYDHDYSSPAPEQIGSHLVERVDGQNCSIAGDGFCDTPPDYLNYRWSCTADGESLVTQTDPTGEKFKSDASFIMGYPSDECSFLFSPEQVDAMIANALSDKADHLYDQTPWYPVVSEDLTVIAPADGDTLTNFKDVFFAWEHMTNASDYIIELSINENFTSPVFRFVVDGNTWISNNLVKNKTYYWRLRPYNRQHSCFAQSDVHVFTTGDGTTTSLENLPGVEQLRLAPNPVRSGQDLRLMVDLAQPMAVEVQVQSLTGQTIWNQARTIPSGQQTLELPVGPLTPGLYLVGLRSAQGQWQERLVVTE